MMKFLDDTDDYNTNNILPHTQNTIKSQTK